MTRSPLGVVASTVIVSVLGFNVNSSVLVIIGGMLVTLVVIMTGFALISGLDDGRPVRGRRRRRRRLGQACGMRTLAEGVETERQLAQAAELGCTFAQGFHIARPMPAEDCRRGCRPHRHARPPPGRGLVHAGR